jgi:death-on-curing protein
VSAIKWLSPVMVLAIHDEALYLFGGLGGVREQSLLESAIDKPRNKFAYEPESSLFALAASLGIGLARNHAFSDGNKRTALLATRAFLFLNGQLLEPQEEDEVVTMIGVATCAVTELQFAMWLEKNCSAANTVNKTSARAKRSRNSRGRSKD